MNHPLVSSAACLLMLAIPLLAEGQRGRGAPGANPDVPYPFFSTNPQQILENIATVVKATGLAESMEMPELRLERNELRAERILQVRTAGPENANKPNGYLLVELVRPNGQPMATVAITPDGIMIGAEDLRDVSPTRPWVRPLDLSIAAERIAQHRGKSPEAITYTYFHNTAEPFANVFRPLVAAQTERGIVYINSAGHAFAHDDSPLLAEFGAGGDRRRSSVGSLVKIGEWQK